MQEQTNFNPQFPAGPIAGTVVESGVLHREVGHCASDRASASGIGQVTGWANTVSEEW